ncbi:FAD/NAD(P)-binding domain-containing protein [Corynespora cassiicola Philippines]|uniref:FAD/NAD(P)-binding domain-containing protein n=1 Tax=Corynespora cassiicola Philippines TaxID=1448308 RepID=A0A2T2NFC8_CORCC|nr:FAD/NAD(P)-binding domain-containing protein [Corynespora cassiicola Philippines]
MAQPNGHTPLPILIAGGGCTGLFLAHLLTHSNDPTTTTTTPPLPNPILVLEPNPPSRDSTRAMAHQPLVFPLFARAGLMPRLAAAGSFSSGLCFRGSARGGSKMIAGRTFDVAKGEKAQLLLPQWRFQEVLLGEVQGSRGGGGGGTVRMGWRVVDFAQEDACVRVQIQNVDTGETQEVEAAYLIGADGAHSTVRKRLGLGFEGETLDAQLVATDLRFDFHAHGFYDANFVIDREDYGLVGRIDNEGLWRVSYGVPAGTSEEEIRAGVHEKLARMLPGEGLDGQGNRAYEVVRIAPYKAQQRCVDAFWKGRVGVVGDAAHLTNPYAGLGLASGLADASSLAPILSHILSPSSPTAKDPAKLLDSWSTARRNLFHAVVDRPSRAAYARVRSKADTNEDVQALLSRDPLVGALKKGMPMMPPSLETKVEELEGW